MLNPDNFTSTSGIAKIFSGIHSFPLPRTIPPPPGTPAIRTNARSATILPNFVGLRFAVHNGKDYIDVFITEQMVGRKLGEFVPYGLSLFLSGFTSEVKGQPANQLLGSVCRTRKRFVHQHSKNS